MGRPRTWTDDDLRDAVAHASTLAEAVRALRLSRGGAAYVTVRTRMEQLGLRLAGRDRDVVRTPTSPARHRWTESDVRDAVARASSLHGVFSELGLTVGGSQWLVLRSLILERGWSTAHWAHPLDGQRDRCVSENAQRFRDVLSDVDLAEVVSAVCSRAELIRSLGFAPSTTTYRLLREALAEVGVSTDHFEAGHEAMRRTSPGPYRASLDQVMVENSSYTNTSMLKRRLVETGMLLPECASCGLDTWLGAPIVLHLDHVNGVRNDHRLENLRLLCPNCHSQTPTFAGRNRGRYAMDEAPAPEDPLR